ncbi:H-type small acid-soluble spore protein [Alkaliphilus serpentinus]|uniref:H-type small acid-soluble spore protein n=2 Tax=Alkaliphilus serpentinus TaxID=1482731 RepID=A0A833M6P4_9FIRM|nr:H-type small acid-soluble spore protein [Alkaliphilus serpentinus]
MDMKRAQEIFSSQNRIPVSYRGKNIWIAELNSGSNTAKIKDDIFSAETREVPVMDLNE